MSARTVGIADTTVADRVPTLATGHHEHEPTASVHGNGHHTAGQTAPSGVFSPPREEDWQRRGREVAAARRAEIAARLAERQRTARNEARLAAWEHEDDRHH
jgi:hypothetical protein